jgi:hypothetical protein
MNEPILGEIDNDLIIISKINEKSTKYLQHLRLKGTTNTNKYDIPFDEGAELRNMQPILGESGNGQ